MKKSLYFIMIAGLAAVSPALNGAETQVYYNKQVFDGQGSSGTYVPGVYFANNFALTPSALPSVPETPKMLAFKRVLNDSTKTIKVQVGNNWTKTQFDALLVKNGFNPKEMEKMFVGSLSFPNVFLSREKIDGHVFALEFVNRFVPVPPKIFYHTLDTENHASAYEAIKKMQKGLQDQLNQYLHKVDPYLDQAASTSTASVTTVTATSKTATPPTTSNPARVAFTSILHSADATSAAPSPRPEVTIRKLLSRIPLLNTGIFLGFLGIICLASLE